MLTTPEILGTAATEVDGIAAAIRAANAAATGPISNVLAAAGDEVSAAAAALFNGYAEEYLAIVKHTAAFHSSFTQTLAGAAAAYAHAEAANAAAVSHAVNAVNTPIQSLLGRSPVGESGGINTPATASAAALEDPIVALVMGHTSLPLPDAEYVTEILTNYIQPVFPGAIGQALFTPEQFWPVTPDLGNLTYNQSVAQGVPLLHNAITTQLAAANDVVVFGFSQSAAIAHYEINALMALGAGAPDPSDLAFVLTGHPNNPDGGLLARFPGFYIPFLDVSFNGATPADNPYATTIYTAQYDPVAHMPQYPLHILSDINAIMGYFYVHNTYPGLTAAELANAVPLPTSPGYTGNTEYFMLLTQDLPLLQPIRDIPVVGPPLANLIQPQLRVLVDLGYADYGPGGNYADVPTPAALFSVPNPFAVSYYLLKGSLQAPYGAIVDIGVDAGLLGPEWLPNTYPWVPSTSPGLNFYFGQRQVTALSMLSGALGDVFRLIPPPVFP
ncbi:PE family protein [Mycobacterium spongiae]|uniref:PE-PPE domain-containing protein n=1 Tax=Mycobacterium spongiae TaxID=886343 RepID=A0A975JUG3_9MYCO|nr:PE-PPE domain-containing protein [Mycobacterium spongiae]QUR65912.1 PE-PPE domain-containing protein [Mycobacterium spongiae]